MAGDLDNAQESSEAEATGNANLDAISESIGDESPTPNLGAIEADKNEAESAKAEYAHLRDADGNPFDPDIHVTQADGSPSLTKRGKLRKRPGRKAGQSSGTTASASRLKTPEGGTAEVTMRQRQQARMSGAAAANALIMLGVTVGGDEWQPIANRAEGIDEREQLQIAFGDYFEAKGMNDIPPGVALSIAVVAYAAPRFTMPKTQSKFQRFRENVAAWIAKRRMRKNAPQPDTRDDGKRQNNAGETASPPK